MVIVSAAAVSGCTELAPGIVAWLEKGPRAGFLVLPQAQDNPARESTLRITELDPPVSWAGELLKVRGEGFSCDPTDAVVFSPGVSAPVWACTARLLIVEVPREARSGILTIGRGSRAATASVVVIPRIIGKIGP